MADAELDALRRFVGKVCTADADTQFDELVIEAQNTFPYLCRPLDGVGELCGGRSRSLGECLQRRGEM